MIVLFGPCMFLAPLLVVLIPIAIVLWPPVLAIVGLLWLIVWPFAALGTRLGSTGFARAHAMLGRWFVILLRPWNYFNAPTDTPKQRTPPNGVQGTTPGTTPEPPPGPGGA